MCLCLCLCIWLSWCFWCQVPLSFWAIVRTGKVTLNFTSVINDTVTRSPIELLGSGTAKTFVTAEIFIFDHNLPFSGISGLKIMRGIFQVHRSDWFCLKFCCGGFPYNVEDLLDKGKFEENFFKFFFAASTSESFLLFAMFATNAINWDKRARK